MFHRFNVLYGLIILFVMLSLSLFANPPSGDVASAVEDTKNTVLAKNEGPGWVIMKFANTLACEHELGWHVARLNTGGCACSASLETGQYAIYCSISKGRVDNWLAPGLWYMDKTKFPPKN